MRKIEIRFKQTFKMRLRYAVIKRFKLSYTDISWIFYILCKKSDHSKNKASA